MMDEQLEFGLRATLRPIGVTELVRAVREALETNLREFWVVGEVSNARRAPSNHFYFTLKDARSSIAVVMFRSAFERVRFRVEDGMKIIVRGRVSVFDQRGALQLYAEELEPRGIGALQIAFEQLKKRLEAEGLFDKARKRALPFLPRTIGIVTARGGAGLRDILTIIVGRFPNLHLIVRPARVQGFGACHEVAEAIVDLNRDGRAEVIIVGRGGGSLEDLWAFNEEVVARAIHRSRIPVISAVGHEIDYTIADFVADFRAPTPTAAAQMVVPSLAELSTRIDADYIAMLSAMQRELTGWRQTVSELGARIRHPATLLTHMRGNLVALARDLPAGLAARLADARGHVRQLELRLRSPAATVRELRLGARALTMRLAHATAARARGETRRVESLSTRLRTSSAAALEVRRRSLAALATRLDSISPLKVLERGYAVVIDPRDGRAVRDATSVAVGGALDIRLARGRLGARVTSRVL